MLPTFAKISGDDRILPDALSEQHGSERVPSFDQLRKGQSYVAVGDGYAVRPPSARAI